MTFSLSVGLGLLLLGHVLNVLRTISLYLSRQASSIEYVGKPVGDSQDRAHNCSQTNSTWERRWRGGQSPEPSLILLGDEEAQRLSGRLHGAVASRRSTMGTSVHPPLILQHLQLPSSARPNNQWRARLPGQRRHPAAPNTFIFPPGRFRLPDRRRQQRQQWRQDQKEKDNGKEQKTLGQRERRDRYVEKESLTESEYKRGGGVEEKRETWRAGGRKGNKKEKKKKTRKHSAFITRCNWLRTEAPGSWQRCKSEGLEEGGVLYPASSRSTALH